MLKDFTWSFFEKTGNIETFLEYNMIQNANKAFGCEALSRTQPLAAPAEAKAD
ncbi:MAG: hypothetical protein BWY15_00890 [Firmicutes bacterium ADurb.Bin193]|nr:MAG: hypothetical protein BWY15_00890 [Firmicutes bacterium ADurb.Bin193]